MMCRECGGDTSVTRTVTEDDGSIVRTRRCKTAPREHPAFKTHERPVVPDPPRLVVKRDGRREPFRRDKIRKSISRALMNPTSVVPASVLDGVLTRVDAAMTVDERSEMPTEQVAQIILDELTNNRQVYAISRIRYAMATATSLERQPFMDLKDFRTWLKREWPYREHKPLRQSNRADTPMTVRRVRGDQAWDHDLLKESIAEAAKGRASATTVAELAAEVADAVRETLRGQVIVTSEQVATEVMRALRTRDPLTYLWYASVHKRFRNATEVLQEIEGLQEETIQCP